MVLTFQMGYYGNSFEVNTINIPAQYDPYTKKTKNIWLNIDTIDTCSCIHNIIYKNLEIIQYFKMKVKKMQTIPKEIVKSWGKKKFVFRCT